MLSIDECWSFLETLVGGFSVLPPGASENAICEAEAIMQVAFPEELRKLLLRHDGSGKNSISPYKIGGGSQTFMALKDIIETWKCMIEIGADFENQGEFGKQTGPIKRNYWNKSWIPVTENGCGDNIVIDLDPPAEGTIGQAIDWWHEGGVSTIQAPSLRAWLNEIVDAVKKGVYKFGCF